MKVKIFDGSIVDNGEGSTLENLINEWLRNNPMVQVTSINMGLVPARDIATGGSSSPFNLLAGPTGAVIVLYQEG